MKNFTIDFVQFFLNYIVAYIPFWNVRKLFYKLSGMKIGNNSRITMKCYFISPWKINIGNGVYINEFCVIDGRGGIEIGDNSSISMGTKIFSGTHDSKSDDFAFLERKVIIKNNVWTGVNAIVLPGSYLPHGMILAAGSVAIPCNNSYEECCVYSGVPAKRIANRNTKAEYILGEWRPWFR